MKKKQFGKIINNKTIKYNKNAPKYNSVFLNY